MATVKTPEERGLLGAWAYDSRDRLGLSPEQVVALIGKYDASTLRKAEGDSRNMSRPLWRELTKLYPKLASEKRITLDAIPLFGDLPEQATGDSDLAAAIREQAQAINALVREIQLSRTAQIAATSAVFEILGVKDRPPYPEDTPDGSEHEAPVATGR